MKMLNDYLQIVFTSSDTFVGQAIKLITGEPYTHVALRLGDKVLHSSFKGVEAISFDEFKTIRNVEATIFVNPQPEDTQYQFNEVLSRYRDAKYDYLALVWLAARYVMKKYCRIDLPKVNLWNVSGMYTCTEFVTEVVDGKADSLITPYKLYERLSNG